MHWTLSSSRSDRLRSWPTDAQPAPAARRCAAILARGSSGGEPNMPFLFRRLVPVAALLLSAPARAGPSFTTVVDNLDPRKNTKMHARDYCRSVRGEDVSWSGVVQDVRGGKARAKVYVADKSRPVYNGYNIVVTTSDLGKASNLKRGQHVKFK